MTTLGIVGYGSIAQAHVRAFKTLQSLDARLDLRLGGVMGRLAEPTRAFALEHGVPLATTELDELLAESAIDAVVICSPTDLHARQTEAALRAGKHVLCEIPLATSLAETDRLIALADQVDRRLMVCHTQRYYPPLIEARRLIATGAVHPTAIVSRYGFLRRANINWAGRQRSWTDNLLWHHGCHAVDAAVWLLGAEAADVVAQVALPSGALQIPMDLTIVMRTAQDQLATVAMSYNTHIPIHDYLVIGLEDTLQYVGGELRNKDHVLVRKTADELDAIPTQDAEFLAAVRERREPAVSARSVRPAMAVLQAAQDTLDARLRRTGAAP